MYKKKSGLTFPANTLALLMIVLISSCSMQGGNDSSHPSDSLERISLSVMSLQEAGLLGGMEGLPAEDELIGSKESVSQVQSFLDDPESYLKLVPDEEEKGEEQMALIEAMYTGATVGRVIERMGALSPELSREYREEISAFIGSSSAEVRGYIDSIGGMENITLSLIPGDTALTKGAFEKDFTWSSVRWYVGFSAATAAGATAARFGTRPWITIPGKVLFLAGSKAMEKQLKLWKDSSEFQILRNVCSSAAEFYSLFKDGDNSAEFFPALQALLEDLSLKDADHSPVYLQLKSMIEEKYSASAVDLYGAVLDMVNFCLEHNDTGKKLITAGTATLAVGTACHFTGSFTSVLEYYNSLVTEIPSWLSGKLTGFDLNPL